MEYKQELSQTICAVVWFRRVQRKLSWLYVRKAIVPFETRPLYPFFVMFVSLRSMERGEIEVKATSNKVDTTFGIRGQRDAFIHPSMWILERETTILV